MNLSEHMKKIGALEDTNGLGELTVYQGITEEHVDKVIYYANVDDAVRELTSDARRFKDRDSFNQWVKKGRTVYTLVGHNNELFGIIWFGMRKFPDNTLLRELDTSHYPFTFSIRLYADARGKGLARKFMAVTFAAYMQTAEYLEQPYKGFWLDTPTKNASALSVYQKFGFEIVSEPSKKSETISEIVMVLPESTKIIAS